MILCDNDPVPVYGLRLLATIIERNPKYIGVLKKAGLERIVNEFYEVGSGKLNRHTISIMKALIEAKEFSLEDISQMQILPKTHQILKSMASNRQDECIDTLLDLLKDLLT